MSSPRVEREWVPLTAFAFVLVALVALAVIPARLLHRLAVTTDTVATTIIPAYDELREFGFAMEERISSSRSRFLYGDARYATRLAEARVKEAASLRALDTIAVQLGPDAAAYVTRLRQHMGRRDSLEQALLAAGGRTDDFRAALPTFDALRDSMLAEVEGLRSELVSVTNKHLADETRWADLQDVVSVALGLSALLAALLVGWFAFTQQRLRRQVQRALDEANRLRAVAERRKDELEQVTESRVRLLRGITHDVKNPLGAAKGYAALLEMGVQGPLPSEQLKLVAGIRRCVDGALTMISDLLDLARADSVGIVVHPATVDIRDVVSAAVNDQRAAAEAAGHALSLQMAPVPLTIDTDALRVGQILQNLLSNAIKYTPSPGRIVVVCERVNHDGAQPGEEITIRVSDSGPGIPTGKREAIFDEFTRLAEDGPQKGHGLGLAISRRLARSLGGDLYVTDADRAGSTFVLSLPTRSAVHAAAH